MKNENRLKCMKVCIINYLMNKDFNDQKLNEPSNIEKFQRIYLKKKNILENIKNMITKQILE